ncbi:hypothetical protein Slin15195_G115330 [Septoria linicola]|uniref:Uncharacterized protein n=1 Tax=Septoria linicola TaxID=215465 RepID=A0A9Q9EPZ3_9PEZI|nr:hypothetical protein Slin14017_G123320 [Septoria linicola]USW58214.1 hypothetical protein Slin15195_G115330 [Septoria linicola]
MQTPPDSDPEARWEDADVELEDLSDAVGSGRKHRRHLESSKHASGLTTRDRQIVRRQRRAPKQRNPLTPDSDGSHGTLLLHKPSSATTRLRTELIDMMLRTHRSEIWYDLVPARIGHSDAIDSAAKALIKASDFSLRRTDVTEESCLSSYCRALESVRDGMAKSSSADDLLCAVAILVNFERLFSGWTSAPMRSHMHGIMAIFMAQAKEPQKPPSELTRTLVYVFWAVGFIGPCVMGVPSPLETPRFLNMDPVPFARDKMSCPWSVVARLRKLSNQLFIRLPRLVNYMKGIQTGSKPADIEPALDLAKELLEMHDDDAETELLHNVTVQKAEEEAGVDTMSYLMKFSTMSEFEAAMHYWSMRMFLLRLCWRMSRLLVAKYQAKGLWSKASVEAQISRMGANVLMGAPWGLGKGEAGRSCVVLDLVAVWGSLNDFDVFAARKISPAKARSMVLYAGQKVMQLSGPTAATECADRLSAATELFVGGQSSGILAFTFKKAEPDG